MNKTKLDELIKKWEADINRTNPRASVIYILKEFVADLKSLKSEQEVEKLDLPTEGERPLVYKITDANFLRMEDKINEIIDRLNLYLK